MFSAFLSDQAAWAAMLTYPVWRISLSSIEAYAIDAALGDYSLCEPLEP